MSKPIHKIKAPIQQELAIFEDKFRDSMKTRVALLDNIMHYIVKRKGKQMRPMFVFLSAKMIESQIGEKTYRAASLVELLHTATLVHDDVVDDAYERRGFFSINAVWKNKIAVLVGDYLLSKGLLLSLDNDDFELLKIVSNAVREMSEGELLQIEKARRLNITETVYYDIICKKTASLLASACSCGAASVTDDKELIENMRVFGEKVGMAFQIKDDLFDFGTEDVGKPLGIDIQEKKMTLPIIYALNNSTQSDQRWIKNTIKRHNKNKKKVSELIDFVVKSGGIEYATEVMHRYRKEAMDIIQELPPSAAKESMEEMIRYTTERKK